LLPSVRLSSSLFPPLQGTVEPIRSKWRWVFPVFLVLQCLAVPWYEQASLRLMTIKLDSCVITQQTLYLTAKKQGVFNVFLFCF
jgi:hypothetical protein